MLSSRIPCGFHAEGSPDSALNKAASQPASKAASQPRKNGGCERDRHRLRYRPTPRNDRIRWRLRVIPCADGPACRICRAWAAA